MRLLLGIGDINTIDNWRRKFAYAAEHEEKKGSHRGVWLFAPEWIFAYFAANSAANQTTAAAGAKVDHDDRLKKARADREELRYQKDLEVLLHVRDATRDVDLFASAVRKGIERLPPACQEIMLAAIDQAENEWIARHGDGIERAATEADGSPGGVESPDNRGASTATALASGVRRKVHHDAQKRPARRRKVSGKLAAGDQSAVDRA